MERHLPLLCTNPKIAAHPLSIIPSSRPPTHLEPPTLAMSARYQNSPAKRKSSSSSAEWRTVGTSNHLKDSRVISFARYVIGTGGYTGIQDKLYGTTPLLRTDPKIAAHSLSIIPSFRPPTHPDPPTPAMSALSLNSPAKRKSSFLLGVWVSTRGD